MRHASYVFYGLRVCSAQSAGNTKRRATAAALELLRGAYAPVPMDSAHSRGKRPLSFVSPLAIYSADFISYFFIFFARGPGPQSRERREPHCCGASASASEQ
jgi:hypothetical protein